MNLIPTLSYEPPLYYLLFFFIFIISLIFSYKTINQYDELNQFGKLLSFTIPIIYIGLILYIISYGYWADQIPLPYYANEEQYAYIQESIGFTDEINFLYAVCLVSILCQNLKVDK